MKMVFSPLISFSKSLPLFLVAFVLVTSTGSISTCHSSPLHHQQCVYEHFSALLEFQSNSSFWNPESRDCCTWEGIKCDRVTGHVTSLTLNHLNIPGKINLESLCRIQSLQFLNISFNQFPSPIPSAIGKLTNLTHLTLSSSKFYGKIPPEMSSLSRLVRLDLSFNGYDDDYSNFIPLELESIGALIRNMSSLSGLGLDYVNMSTEGNQWSQAISSVLPNLHFLSLYHCSLSGTIHPSWLTNLSTLTHLDLSDNNLHGIIPSSLFTLPSLQSLRLWGNQLSGQLSEFHNLSSSVLEITDLSENQLQGKIPRSIFQLRKLNLLELSYNNFSGVLDLHGFKNLKELFYLGLGNNSLEGSLTVFPPSITTLVLARNYLNGEIPKSICNASSLKIFDLSGNNFSGSIPQCLGNMSNALVKEDCSLEKLDLSENQFEGVLPVSLANCKHLTILNLGNNQIRDTFPLWVHGFADLQIFILRSNYFYGPIELPPTCQNFSKLQLVDLSFNNFNGSLPPTMFCGWKKMTGADRSEPEEYLKTWTAKDFFFFEQIMIRSKGSEMKFSKISTSEAIIDLSSNHLEGRIPETIGVLKSLRVLNMSHNAFTGQIPKSFKNMTALESLDLSQNKLSENIPLELSELTFLSVLNLSENQLTGSIPHDKQFSTYTNESFQGNPGLCGPPLSKMCEGTNGAPSSTSTDAESFSESEYNWKIMATGFALGYGFGVGALCWILVIWTKGRRAYNKFVYKMILLILPSAV
ncbi:hypothetical protein ACLOJK_015629 [Asimina triloba]